MKQAIPDVAAIAFRKPQELVWRLQIICPFCGDRHTHGGGSDKEKPSSDMYGHRVSHCKRHIENCPGYNLVPAESIGNIQPDKTGYAREYIYFILSDKEIKIGRTDNITRRMKEIKRGHEHEQRLIAQLPYINVVEAEKVWHKHFAAYRLHGEWFGITEQMVNEAIQAIQAI